jgi:EAL domain-containing protein (putative c-di-GMP-specific phosphodiesterase class I)
VSASGEAALHTADKIRAIHDMVDRGDVGIAFQPIVEVRRRRLHAYEALARRSNDVFASTPDMFAAAVQAGRVAELGRLHRDQAIRYCPGHALFINVDPHEFDFGWLVRPDDPIFRHRHPVTLEITESVPIKYFSQCHSVLAEIRRKGLSLAIDDLGAGFSNLKYISDLQPEIVKLDRDLIAGVQKGSRQYRLLRSLVSLCHDMEAQVIAEGIESESELYTVIDLGVDFAQGYVFGRPAAQPPDPIWPGTLR